MQKNSILIVDDESANIIALSNILSQDYILYASCDGLDAIEVAEKLVPDVILLDVIMPELDGYTVIKNLRNSEIARDIPVIFVTGLDSIEDEEKGLFLGAADYITKPFSAAVVRLRVGNQIRMINQMYAIERLSMTDQLTEIANRRSFDQRLNLEWRRAIRDKLPISLLIVDVDRFKDFNDTYGHQQGDVALHAVAKTLTRTLKRPADFVARWGGEEFAVLLPATEEEGAMMIAEQIRKNIEKKAIMRNDGVSPCLTVSIGLNTKIPTQYDSVSEYVSKADTVLYTAKEMGRNRICKV